MSILSTSLRKQLEKCIREARIVAEEAAADAIRRMAVAPPDPPAGVSAEHKALRVRLRAHGRTLGDTLDAKRVQTTVRLQEAAAYEIWHRMLFARFLVERGLLLHPDLGAPLTLAELAELAPDEGAADAWALAERYAAATLPAVFKPDDPVLALPLDPYYHKQLQGLVTDLDPATFEANDSLGWTYQFWRADEKDAANKAGCKIGAVELPAVTQLFTEPYMVHFLLHNTLGAWWAGKVLSADPDLARNAKDEVTLRAACALPEINWEFLRFARDPSNGGLWRPAAGSYTGWPEKAAAITLLDPCCGSGHFLVEALPILAAIRCREEGIVASEAARAVLRDNLFGLEIDGRCVQIAAFAVALAAWRIGGWQTLPLPHIAWVGAPPPLPKREFVALAQGDPKLEYALGALHDLFAQAPLLGTLLEPSGGDLFEAEKMRQIEHLLEPLLAKARRAEPEQVEGVIAARGMADAAALLHRGYVLQATNVPYLGRGKQDAKLAAYIERRFDNAKADLSSAMLTRMSTLSTPGGTFCAVTPQSWLFLGSYKGFRYDMLTRTTFNILGALGPRAFETISGEVVNTVLAVLSASPPSLNTAFAGLDANEGRKAEDKAAKIASDICNFFSQARQVRNPDHTISLVEREEGPLLQEHAWCYQGTSTGDNDRCVRYFWEQDGLSTDWKLFSSPPELDFGHF